MTDTRAAAPTLPADNNGPVDTRTGRRNVALLAACQGLLLTNGVTLVAVNSLAGLALAPDKRLATLPITAYVVGGALSTMPMSQLMQRAGRRSGFMTGAGFGIVGALIGALAVGLGSFALLCLAGFLAGIYNAAGQYYRFAAADTAPPELRSRAISLVLAGGLAGGVLGPETSKLTRSLLEPDFLGAYLALAGFAVLAMAITSRLRIPPLSAAERAGGGRPLGEIARQPVFIVAVLGAVAGYGIMNLLMSATPLAMDMCRHPYADAAFVLEWHVVGMFAPSFFTGSLIKRHGVLTIMAIGAALMAVCTAIALAGTTLMHFWWALVLLGVGWNFLFIGGTTLLTEAHTPAERARTQGANDLAMFLTMALTSLASGVIVTGRGWEMLNWFALPVIAAAGAGIAWLWVIRRREGRAAAPTSPAS